jgi:hypothetical protein
MFAIISSKMIYKLDGPSRSELYIIACFILFTIGDFMRIPFALYGNQAEQVSALAASLLVTGFPTLPALAYLTFFQPALFPFEYIAGIVQFIFIFIEFPLIWKALKKNADVQQARFIRLTNDSSQYEAQAKID